MRKHSKVILAAEEQLVFGHSLSEMVAARDNLRSVVPESLLLELLEARIVRRRLTYRPVSPGQRKDKKHDGARLSERPRHARPVLPLEAWCVAQGASPRSLLRQGSRR